MKTNSKVMTMVCSVLTLLFGNVAFVEGVTTEFYDLDDNQIPPGWTLEIGNPHTGTGIHDGKLWSHTIDGYATLSKDLTPGDFIQLTFEYDSQILGYSYWGVGTSILISFTDGEVFEIYDKVEDYRYGNNLAVDYFFYDSGSRTLIDTYGTPEYIEYHHTLSIRDGVFTTRSENGGSVLYDEQINDARFAMSNIQSISYRTFAHTENDVWMDNIRFTTEPIPEPATLLLLDPNGGENWVAGSTYTITWADDEETDVDFVLIEYSTNNGQDWNYVDIWWNTGSYEWDPVPAVNSNQCLVRISDLFDPDVNDTSDDVFTIFQCQVEYAADLDGNCYVNFYDFALFATDWLECGNPFDPTCAPEGMVFVPGGEFPYQNSTPIFVDTFFIAKYETTNTEYCQFLNDDDPCGLYYDPGMEIDINDTDPCNCSYTVQDGNENYPIRYANLYDAEAFASWRSNLEGATYRLPTEQEWEKAAGWDPVLEKLWTYGFQRDTIDCTWCNYNNCYGGPLAVGSFNGTGGKEDAYSYYGCYDMSGNVWDWTSSIYSGNIRVLRGGGWPYDAALCSVTYRTGHGPSLRDILIGFRLVRELE